MPSNEGSISPQAITACDVDRKLVLALRTGHGGVGVAFLVDTTVEVLQERKVGGEKPLDRRRCDLRDRPQPGDDPRQEDDGEVGLVLADAWVALGQDLIARCREAHRAFPVQGAAVIHVAPRERKGELGTHMLAGASALERG